MGAAPTRPALRWHGGKWKLAPWVISHFPAHRIYVEPFGGGASVLLRKGRTYAEVYNDLDSDVVNFFRVLRSPEAGRLIRMLRLTPHAREEFEMANAPQEDPVDRAWALVVRAFMGHGSNSHQKVSGFRAKSNESGNTPAHDWANYPDALAQVVERFQGVIIENRGGLEVMASQDHPEALHYVDPPYVHSTRQPGQRRNYAHEMTDADHVRLLTFLKTLKGSVVLSGYPSPLYDEHLAGWRCFTRSALADGASPRVEALWLNDRADVVRLL